MLINRKLNEQHLFEREIFCNIKIINVFTALLFKSLLCIFSFKIYHGFHTNIYQQKRISTLVIMQNFSIVFTFVFYIISWQINNLKDIVQRKCMIITTAEECLIDRSPWKAGRREKLCGMFWNMVFMLEFNTLCQRTQIQSHNLTLTSDQLIKSHDTAVLVPASEHARNVLACSLAGTSTAVSCDLISWSDVSVKLFSPL